MLILDARPKIVEKLKAKGLLVSIDEHYRPQYSHQSTEVRRLIEPQIRLQWFIDVNKPVVDWKGKKQSFKEVLQAVIKDRML